MFIDATELTQSPLPKADLCIVGAGAAGLTMVGKLANSGLRIILLESGGRPGQIAAPDTTASSLNAGTSPLSDYPFETSRARGFGGTTALWTGACVPLDADDFAPRDWVPYSGWPITADDLAPYYREAAPIYGMVKTDLHQTTVEDTPFHGGALEARFAQLTKRPHIGAQFESRVASSGTITCVLGATVTALIPQTGSAGVEGVEIGDRDGIKHRISARCTVLATGGIEAPRLLLLAPPELRAAMGPSVDAIGRYHMEHPIRSLGVIKVPDARSQVTGFTDLTPTTGADLQGVFGLNEETRRRENLLNLHFRAYRFHALENDPAIIRLKSVAMGAEPRVSGMLGKASPGNLWKWGRYGAWHLWNKASRRARFDHVRLLAFLEQEPDPDNRITLGDQTDRFGTPLPHLTLTESARMKSSVTRTLALIGKDLDAKGLPGHRLGEAGHLAHYGGYGLHHMGGTRMSADKARGVVDANCRVHGLQNLYIASSSVFATGGAANPTLTISALSLRLSDHLLKTLS